MWSVGILIVLYIVVMFAVVRHNKKQRAQQYLIFTFADLMVFYGLQSQQVRQFREQHPDTELLRKCDALALEFQPSSKPYIMPED